ncbi:hypothetical protein ALC53_05813 [Atta colombica]|uniref:Uncharacterized protein n=1 Tax=Atta colombica TaxID=520822 RepID=A0A195BGK9_9HYME|nr:hypothetical protein ALC53_05813 [Atta colombica]
METSTLDLLAMRGTRKRQRLVEKVRQDRICSDFRRESLAMARELQLIWYSAAEYAQQDRVSFVLELFRRCSGWMQENRSKALNSNGVLFTTLSCDGVVVSVIVGSV